MLNFDDALLFEKETDMRIMSMSDTHFGHPGWDGFGEKVVEKAIGLAKENPVDVLLFCGDVVEPENRSMELADGLALLKTIPATKRLWVAGNNDITFVLGREGIWKYADDLQKIADKFGFQLLDSRPFLAGDVAIVGNFGFYDLSLWRAPRVRCAQYPSTEAELRRGADEWYERNMRASIQEIFDFCQKRLREHIRAARGRKLVIATHTVPDPGMVVYGHSPAYDFQNAWMGWDDGRSSAPLVNTPNLVLQFCGHTHRSGRLERAGRAPLVNVSGEEQPLIFTV